MKARVTAILLAVGLIMATAGATASNPSLDVVSGGLPHHALLSIAFDGKNGIAVGSYGEIQTTTDGGAKWNRTVMKSGVGLFGTAIRDDLRLIVGQGGAIFVSKGSEAFKKVESGITERFLGVALGGNGTAVAVGGFGAIAVSTDSGQTWVPLQLDWATLMPTAGEGVIPHLYAAHIAEDGAITVAGEYSGIFRSLDQGQTWTVLNGPKAQAVDSNAELSVEPAAPPPSIFALDIAEDGRIFAVGQDGLILHSGPEGCNFERQTLKSRSLLYAVRAQPDGTALAAGMYAMIHTDDQGKTWRRVSDPSINTSWYSGAERSPSGDGSYLLVGKSGTISRFKP